MTATGLSRYNEERLLLIVKVGSSNLIRKFRRILHINCGCRVGHDKIKFVIQFAKTLPLPEEYKKQALVLLQEMTELTFTGELYYS